MLFNMGKEALAAANDEHKRNAFIHKNENFILNCASKFSKHYISKSCLLYTSPSPRDTR